MTVDDLLRSAAADLDSDVRATTDAESALERVVATPPSGRAPWLLLAAALVAVFGLAAAVLVATAADDDEPVTSGPTTEATTPPTAPPARPPGGAEGVDATVTPDTGLADGDVVQVTAAGLPPEPGLIELYMCAGDAAARAPSMDACSYSGTVDSLTAVDGRIETSFAVEQVLFLRDGPVDCARDAVPCSVGVAVNRPVEPDAGPMEGGPELIGTVGVSFAPLVPLADPTITVTPAEGLAHGQVVTIAGEGYAGSVGRASLCAPPAGDRPRCTSVHLSPDEDLDGQVETDVRGRFSVEAPVWRAFPVVVDTGYEIVDCAEVGCTLTIERADGLAAPPVPLDFAFDTPTPAPPTMEVTPTTGLRPGDPVTITVRGLAAGTEAMLSACALGGGIVPGGCGQATSLEPIVGEEDGETTLTVPAVDPTIYGLACTEPGTCAVKLDGGFIDPGDPLIEAVPPVPMQYAP